MGIPRSRRRRRKTSLRQKLMRTNLRNKDSVLWPMASRRIRIRTPRRNMMVARRLRRIRLTMRRRTRRTKDKEDKKVNKDNVDEHKGHKTKELDSADVPGIEEKFSKKVEKDSVDNEKKSKKDM